jgi:Holliday junction resolvasome RuvABC endonuclease subunit
MIDQLVLGIDPSLRCTGLALVRFAGDQPPTLVGQSVFSMVSAKDVDPSWIADSVIQTLRQMQLSSGRVIDLIGMEVPIHAHNPGVLIRQARVIGNLDVLLSSFQPKRIDVNPVHTKQAFGLGRVAKKEEVIERCKQMVPTYAEWLEREKPNKPVREAVADAVGVALAARVMQ